MALKKNNEEGAKLYLQNAAMKKKESLNLLRMSLKLDAISSQLKSNQSNQMVINVINQIDDGTNSINYPLSPISRPRAPYRVNLYPNAKFRISHGRNYSVTQSSG